MLAAREETDDTAGPRTVCKKTQEGFARRPAGTAAVRDPRELPWRRTGGGAELLCLRACLPHGCRTRAARSRRKARFVCWLLGGERRKNVCFPAGIIYQRVMKMLFKKRDFSDLLEVNNSFFVQWSLSWLLFTDIPYTVYLSALQRLCKTPPGCTGGGDAGGGGEPCCRQGARYLPAQRWRRRHGTAQRHFRDLPRPVMAAGDGGKVAVRAAKLPRAEPAHVVAVSAPCTVCRLLKTGCGQRNSTRNTRR